MQRGVDDRWLLGLLESVLPVARWKALEGRAKAQIYSLRVVVWMMLLQRLDDRGTQQRAVHEIAQEHLERLLPESKRVREGRISQNTGAYARACGRLSLETTAEVCDEVLAELSKRIGPAAELDRAVMLLDGSSLSVEHSAGLLDAFPAGRNQHGLGHWGVVKWVALHDVQTGIALRPEWGPMFGPEAVSEQALGARRLLPNGERRVCWRPSSFERNKYPELPADAAIEGRLIVVTQKGFRDSWYLFTTLREETEAAQIVAWYGQRWNLELDLRTLKGTLRLKHMQGKTRAVVEKELLIAVVAYGMVRALMAEAAARAGLHPRALSFTRAHGLLNAMTGKLCSPDDEQRQQSYDRLLAYIGQAKLPKRSKTRTYPRAVWGSGKYYPGRQSVGTRLQSK
jgi:hypothetical protein